MEVAAVHHHFEDSSVKHEVCNSEGERMSVSLPTSAALFICSPFRIKISLRSDGSSSLRSLVEGRRRIEVTTVAESCVPGARCVRAGGLVSSTPSVIGCIQMYIKSMKGTDSDHPEHIHGQRVRTWIYLANDKRLVSN